MNMYDFNDRFNGGILGEQPAPFVPFGGYGGQPAQTPKSGLSDFLPMLGNVISSGLAGGRNFQAGLAEADRGAAQIKAKRADDATKTAINNWMKAGSPRDPNHPALRALFDAAPVLAEKYAMQQMAPTGQDLTAEQKNYRAGLQDPNFKDYQEHMRPGLDENNPLNVRRWTLSANAAVKPYTELSAYKLVANAAPFLSRIEAVQDAPGSVSDQELLDSVTKLNTGGNQVTEAQVNLVLKGRSLQDQINVWSNYMAANGGVLSDDQRKQLRDVAHAVYKGYQKMYQPIRDAAVKQLKGRGIPEAYWGAIPDLNSLSQAAGIATDGQPAAGDPLAQARDAIAKGAPRDAVMQRLQEHGIDASGL